MSGEEPEFVKEIVAKPETVEMSKRTKMIKFRVRNYKSIKDSGNCYLADGIIVLAGKNESGKTSILEALEDFDTDKEIRTEAKPINNDKLKPEIEITFEIEKEDFKEMGFQIINKTVRLTVVKDFDNKYSLINSKEILSEVIKENNQIIKLSKEDVRDITKIMKKHQIEITLNPLDGKNFSEVSNQISTLKQNLEQYKANLSDKEYAEVDEVILNFERLLEDYIEPENFEKEFLEEFKKQIPNFILFDTYNDQIPSKVPIDQLKDDAFIRDLVAISDLNIEILQNPDKLTENIKHKKRVNIKISEEYKKFWGQDEASLFLEWGNGNLNFLLEEKGEYYEPKQRSRGRQWHLAFYVRVTARSREDVANIILIDEPGLFLHATAQRDILRKLEEISKKVGVIFSTHSPYLIDPNKFNRVRLIEKSDEQGTRVNKVHAKADKETLTPILTAIGEDLSQGIRVDKKNSFIVEGISDYYYLHAFSKILSFKEEINVIPGCGDNIPAVAAILFGWGLDPYFILDSDKQKVEMALKKRLDISDNVIIKISNEKGTIEDLFSGDDLKKFVLEDESADLSGGFVRYLKDLKSKGKNLSKELPARKFFEKVHKSKIKKTDLSDDSVRNIQALFDKIEKLIESQNQAQND